MIPRQLHQIWLGDAPLPTRALETWQRLNPGWEYRLWREDTPGLFPLVNQDKFDRAQTFTVKSDLMRYEVLLRHGGVYVDADMIALRPLDAFLSFVRKSAFLVQDRHFKSLLTNAMMGSMPGHPLLAEMVTRIARMPPLPRKMHGMRITGPGLLTRLVRHPAYRHIVQAFPWETWMQPYGYPGGRAYGIHVVTSHPAHQAWFADYLQAPEESVLWV